MHVTIPLSSDRVSSDRDFLSLATSVPARRLEFRLGKFDLADSFDVNAAGSDSYHQFMNWTDDQNGAYDYAADTRGYTVGGLVEYEDHIWGVRFAEALMPKVANGIALQWNLVARPFGERRIRAAPGLGAASRRHNSAALLRESREHG